MNKVLESKQKQVMIHYESRWKPGEISKKEFKVVRVLINNLFNCVTQKSRIAMKGYKELAISLATKGMQQPIILIANTPENWSRACLKVVPDFINFGDRKGKDWLVLAGNTRMAFAEEYKYDYIDSIIVTSFIEMHAVQLLNGEIKHELEAVS